MIYFSKRHGFQTTELHGLAIPSDAIQISEKRYFDLMVEQGRGATLDIDANGNVIAVSPPAPSRDTIHARYTKVASIRVNTVARDLGYDDAKDILTFVDDPNPKYDREARHFRQWRSKFWTEFDRRMNDDHPRVMDKQSILDWVDSLPKYEPETNEGDSK